MRNRLIENWREAWRFLSVRLAGLLALLSLAYDYLPALQSYVGPLSGRWVAVASTAIIVARLLAQRAR